MATGKDQPALHDLVREAKAHEQRMVLWPAKWQEYGGSNSLRWKSHPFNTASRAQVPNKPGVYAFLIKPGIANLPVAYLMYIGKTDRSLRTRFDEYLADARQNKGRPTIAVLLRSYEGYLDFCCAAVGTPEAVERNLLAAFIPPANKQLPAKVGRVIRAFR